MDPLSSSSPFYTFSFSDSPKKYHVFNRGNQSVEISEEQDNSAQAKASKIAQATLHYAIDGVADRHEWDGKFYLAFQMSKYPTYSVYCFNRTTGELECIAGGLKRPEFIGNRLVEFGTGCDDNRPELTGFVITLYDLDKAAKPRECGKIKETVGRYWSLSVNHREKIIEGCDQTVYNKEYEIPGLKT